MTSQFAPFRDCFICHTLEFQPLHPDRAQEPNTHHRVAEATSGDCVHCHGSLVDGLTDGHTIPTYQPSLVTPWPSEKNFGRCDETCDGAVEGACSVSADPCLVDADCPGVETCEGEVAGTCSVSSDPCLVLADCAGSDTQCVTDANCLIAGEVCNPDLDGGGGGAANARGTEEGNCNYCHDSSTTDSCDEVAGTCVAVPATACQIDADCNGPILINHDTHHFTGLTGVVIGPGDEEACLWCHQPLFPGADIGFPKRDVFDMRTCENCHGISSLHNLQKDSNGGGIDPGAEDAYYGHIGNNTDCNGCHGFTAANAPESGPVVPQISNVDDLTMTAGIDTTITITGAAFTNTVMYGAITLTSDVELTASDGSTTLLTPDSVTESEIVVTLPGSLAVGNYDLRVVKGPKSSNQVIVSVTPAVLITDTDCSKKKGVLTITGSGFSEKSEGTDEYINVEVNGQSVDLISWTDTQIRASVSGCSNKDTVTVNSLYDSASSGSSKPTKPCKGKGCNK
jgi:hypothetical protein